MYFLLTVTAVYLLYNTQEETAAGADGCRSAILWRYYTKPRARAKPRSGA